MSDLTAFLRTRVAEDEEAARAAGGAPFKPIPRWLAGESNGAGIRRDDGVPVAGHSWPHEMDHIARWDPARVLAECAAKRELVDLHEATDQGIVKNGKWNEATQTMEPRRYWFCGVCDYDRDYGYMGDEKQGCETLLLLGSMYADHPEYRDEWRPI